MPKTKIQTQTQKNKAKNIKSVYIHKINSLCKIAGQKNVQLSLFRNKVRRSIISADQVGLLLKRKENNKDAARKARERKKIYMNLLEQYVKKLQMLSQEGKLLQKYSNQTLQALTQQPPNKSQDQIGQYLIQLSTQKQKTKAQKDSSKATMDFQRQCQLHKIVDQIEKLTYPTHLHLKDIEQISKTAESRKNIHKMQNITQQLPQIFIELKSLCQDHAALHVMTASVGKNVVTAVDPYICKTLMQQYYSPTLCKKDVGDWQVDKYVTGLSRLQNYFSQVKYLIQ